MTVALPLPNDAPPDASTPPRRSLTPAEQSAAPACDILRCIVRSRGRRWYRAAERAQDGATVRAALTTPWSNAQAGGHVAKMKLLKRRTCGRANFDLLRRRVLLAA